MADEDPKLDTNRYYTPPGVTEPILRPEFAAEEAAKVEATVEEPSAPAKKTRKASKTTSKKR